ncbi:hypothetical protein A2U01_0075256, partial [Trifolium medium]|nr:hypothetical protein [Trifolium medium]
AVVRLGGGVRVDHGIGSSREK